MHSSLRVAWRKCLDQALQIEIDFDNSEHRALMNDLKLDALDVVREFCESCREIDFAFRAEAARLKKGGN